MAIENVIVGSNLGPEFSVGVDVTDLITLRVGDGLTHNPDGSLTIDSAAIAALIADGSEGDTRLVALGFDAATETLTASLSDGSQVTAGMPGVVTASVLEAAAVPLLDVFDQPVPGVRVLTA